MKFFREFKDFIKRGNVLDLAVALLIGSAFTAIVSSLANDVIMPPISMLLNMMGVEEMKWVLRPAVIDADTGTVTVTEIAIKYGNFVNAIINFLILALCVFVIVKLVTHAVNRTKEAKKRTKEILKDKTMTEEEKQQKLAELKAEEETAAAAATEPPAPAETQEDILRDIRELLKARSCAGTEEPAASGNATGEEKK